MARPSLLRGSYVTLYIGDGANPEYFRPVCGLITRGLSHQVQTRDNYRRDCDNPAAIPVRGTTATGQQWDVSGQGLMAREVYEDLKNTVGRTVSWRYSFDEPADDVVVGGMWAGRGMLTQLQIVGADGDDVQVDIAVASSGRWEWLETYLALAGVGGGAGGGAGELSIIAPEPLSGTAEGGGAGLGELGVVDPVPLAGVAAGTGTGEGTLSDGVPVIDEVEVDMENTEVLSLTGYTTGAPPANVVTVANPVGSQVQVRYIA